MANLAVHYSSASVEWETPQWLFEQLSNEFGGFNTDVCATVENAKCNHFWTQGEDGLTKQWRGNCWMNPPYGREIAKWVKKAYESDALVVCLLPARTDTAWWHDYCTKGEIRFLRGRLKFSGHKRNAPFPNAIVIFEQRRTR
jgi:phage N-6-adenine-methyltransferase